MPRKTTGRETNKQKREQSKKKQNTGGIEKQRGKEATERMTLKCKRKRRKEMALFVCF